jgi:hypothetical protein
VNKNKIKSKLSAYITKEDYVFNRTTKRNIGENKPSFVIIT